MRTMTFTSSADSLAAGASAQVQNVPVTMDTKSRVRTSKEQRRLILAEFERDGLSAAGPERVVLVFLFRSGVLRWPQL
jgi:hypothetical protein